jgi:Domain of unknown function (DUF4388)
MKFSGHLSEYSLAEIFSFIHEGNRTGLLTLSPDRSLGTVTSNNHDYLWFENGRIVTVTSGLEGSELLTKIEQRRLVSQADIYPVTILLDRLPQPLGIYLKSQGLLDAAQLKFLFNSQTISPIHRLFELKNSRFQFDPGRSSINSELTGINASARDLGMLSLRLLKDWSGLSAKLPDPHYAIQRCNLQQPNFELNRHELELWKLADGKTPLIKLAVKMALSIEIVRQISFRLSVFGTIREIPHQQLQPSDSALILPLSDLDSKQPPVSTKFLSNLKNFLKKMV